MYNIMESLNQLALGIFFLYFVLITDSCSTILNCGLQRYISKSVLLKHVIIFLSIYIFTFILNWYTIDSIVVEKFENSEDDNDVKIVNFNESQQYLIKSFIYSVFIYVIFILSTKSEGKYLVFFLLGIVFMVFLQIILKSMYGPLSEFKMANIFKSNAELKQMAKESELPYDQNLTNVLRIIPGLYAIIGGVLLTGVGKYYMRQRKDHSKKWDTMTFIFGNNKCSGV